MAIVALAYGRSLPGSATAFVVENLRAIGFVLFLVLYSAPFIIVHNKETYAAAESWFAGLDELARRQLRVLVPVVGIGSFLIVMIWYLRSL